MRYYLFLLLMVCVNVFSEEIKPLPQGDSWRKYIAQSLRDEEGLRDGLFNLRRIEANTDIAYVCGLIKDKNDNFLPDAQGQYHLYDRVMVKDYKGNWVSAVRFDKTIDSLQDVHCHYGKDVPLTSALLETQIASQGRKDICQPVNANDPLRGDILNGLRASYVGDSNSVTLNGPLPTVKFIVNDLCATNDYAWFFGKPTGDRASLFIHDDADNHLRVVLKKFADGVWRPMPENSVLTQQSKVGDRYYGMLRERDLAQLAQACSVEGDTVMVTGKLHQLGSGEKAYWVVTPEKPLTCVRDADDSQPGWNQAMQLALTTDDQESFKKMAGKKVTVGGDVSLALSADHHTPLVLENLFRLTENK
ncbi:DUF4431 domain-containing protein [Enterobacter kobei]|uniref:DUF4431 domain-containing protein n=1 Tax=Enterobacter kobei TaxID=208224 RepID=UPI00201FEBEB|nr:DUF4431 domain-containing protein [Enterobacter kobei]MCL8165943.1 DUF4431 domain-containing protein [Enterobacter kobei]MCM7795964.1 DUF4431 domain-containing protein [Enterobacter kobei]HDT5931923.1 DUF4431 domain-containing protein [Enterobacter kobei]